VKGTGDNDQCHRRRLICRAGTELVASINQVSNFRTDTPVHTPSTNYHNQRSIAIHLSGDEDQPVSPSFHHRDRMNPFRGNPDSRRDSTRNVGSLGLQNIKGGLGGWRLPCQNTHTWTRYRDRGIPRHSVSPPGPSDDSHDSQA
jgi:hypothetical protein